MKNKLFHFMLMLAILAVPLLSVAAQDDELAPSEIMGEAIYIPFDVKITLDGNLEDWAGVPISIVDRGPSPSLDPAENGSFDVALAANGETLFVRMTMKDKNIITGQHGTEFWNEDSLEFYINLTDSLNTTSYTDGIAQINVNPSDIGKTDPTQATISGSRSSTANVQAIVFATEDGWGFEASLPLPFMPEHGKEIGFQAQANGAATADRNVKLIWSNYDTADNSWQDPSLFGRGLFFEIGETEVPMPTAHEEEVVIVERRVSLNQVGYYPDAPKIAALVNDVDRRLLWSIINTDTQEMVMAGYSEDAILDTASGAKLHQANFSLLTTPGTYMLNFDGVNSAPFIVGTQIYSQLANDALHYFYQNRSGIELEAQYAGEAWARSAGHLTDNAVTCYQGTDADGIAWEGCGYTLDGSRGWYDAGDYGKYVVNAGISVWTLLNLYERFPEIFPDGSLAIPENTNGVSDILDEVRWEMDFMLGMQVPEGEALAGMVHHKLHDLQWAGIPVLPATEVDNNDKVNGRYAMPPSTTATLNLAATAAQCARIWADIDPDFSTQCLNAATKAWQAANEHPDLLAGNTPGVGGGNYPDNVVEDEFYWAAAELYITTGEAQYLDYLTASPYFASVANDTSAMNWGETQALGTISLLITDNGLSSDQRAELQKTILEAADRYLTVIDQEGFNVNIPARGYVWGSTSSVMNNAIILALAYDQSQDKKYLDGVTQSMDYLLGMNALAFSFVAGYGDHALSHPHHRFWGNDEALGFPPPPPGALSGGPNGNLEDPTIQNAGVTDFGPARYYIDDIGSYSTNEVAINWNSPLTWVTTYLDQQLGR